jgi:hypothetical protein
MSKRNPDPGADTPHGKNPGIRDDASRGHRFRRSDFPLSCGMSPALSHLRKQSGVPHHERIG